uniref:Phage minor tail protein n=1 Tax=Citrobacter freundii TaxID=546 RepID=A0A385ELT5_CITFR|nr:Phage minor tail protein [Citrobacter freundii]
MSAGTLTLNNNSASVAGTDTTFTTELAAGDFIVVVVGGVPYTLPVLEVNSNTRLTLVSNYTGPRATGAAWSADKKRPNTIPVFSQIIFSSLFSTQ